MKVLYPAIFAVLGMVAMAVFVDMQPAKKQATYEITIAVFYSKSHVDTMKFITTVYWFNDGDFHVKDTSGYITGTQFETNAPVKVISKVATGRYINEK